MNKYIVVAFAVMAMAFYELSGGSDFEPGDNSLVVFADPKPFVVDPKPRAEFVARADTGGTGLTDIAPARAIITPVATNSVAPAAPVALSNEVTLTEPEQVAPTNEVATPVPEAQPDLRFVDGDRVNLRGGPGTDYAVVGKLFRDDMVEILKDEGNGWVHLRATATGDEGWMADWLVTAAN